MTSTEFSIGMSSDRNSSKVLKPPGGGSSDIFGNQNNFKNGTPVQDRTKDRLFGGSDSQPDPVKVQQPCHKMQSDIFGMNDSQSKPNKKKFVRRNPITGELVEIYIEKNGENEESKENEDAASAVVEPNMEEKKEDGQFQPANTKATSVRVRQPPGGKSSGIF